MNISEFCIKRPVFTILLMAAILFGGIFGYKSLAVSALPNVDFPTISVSANLSGASPETMASAVATPLERQFSNIAGITSITSQSVLGSTRITIQFDLSRDIDGAALDVQTAISGALRKLPKEMTTPPSFQKVNPADQPVLFVAVSSDTLPISQVNEFADTMIAQNLSTIKGVAQVQIFGEQKYAVRIKVDPNKLAAQNLSFDEVKTSLAAAASNSPVGVISGDKQLFNLEIKGQPKDAEGFKELIAIWKNGSPVKMKDIADITDDVEDNRSTAYINGKQAVVIAIQRQPDANTVEVVNKILERLPSFREQLPASIELTPMFNRSISIKDSIHDVQLTLFFTIALVIAVIFLFLRNVSGTIIPAIAVPLSIMATYGCMALFGFSINNISLLALTLCVGFVVDDAIVMLENIIRYIEEGMKPMDAALKGSKEIGFTIISITLSLVAVFIPILFMGGVVGRILHEFAVTMSIAILVSAFVSLTLTPMMCSRFLKGGAHKKEEGKFGKKLEASFNWLLEKYRVSLDWSLKHKKSMLVFTIATLAISVASFMYVPKGFFPLEDTGFLFGQAEASQDISYDAMVEKQKQLAEILKKHPAVNSVFFAVGGGRGALNSSRVFVGLKPKSERVSAFEIIKQLRKETSKVEGLNVFFQPIQNIQLGGRLSKSLYQYTLKSSDLNKLYQWGEKLTSEISATKGFLDVNSDLQLKSLQALINIDQAKAASLGVDYEDVRQALYSAFGTAQVANLYTPSNSYSVILEVKDEFQKTPEDVGKIYIRSSNGNLVLLESIATITRSAAPLSVNHQEQLPAVTISFNLVDGFSLGDAVKSVNEIQKKLSMPDSIIGSFQGSAQIFQDSLKGQGLLIFASIIVIYIILGMLYESFIHPITILSGLPSAGIGAVISLLIFGMDLSIIAIVGIVLLIGIVKKNAIMMIDFAITARAEGKSAEDAIYQAALTRFRPIMMTSLAAIFGTLPIALGIGAGAELRQPLGITVVGGLLTSQFLTLYITPVIYLYLEKLRTKI
jgi:HAE1 family hydrophobic/amphiphilic exporter-1